MKNWIALKWSLALTLITLPFAGGCLQENTVSAEPTSSALGSEPVADELAQVPDEDNAAVSQEAEADVSDAPVKPLSFGTPLPENFRPSEPLLGLIRLAESGVEESVLLNFVTTSAIPFNLRSEEIVYLTDIGVPATVITAMLQRDHMLRGNPPEASLNAQVPAPTLTDNPNFPTTTAPSFAPAPLPEQNGYSPENQFIPDRPAEIQNYSEAAPATEAAYSTFYDSLAPYGSWVDVEGQGPCWQPAVVVVNRSWQPYFDSGNWVYTDCGWYWRSDYSWGWAPFHYGRWFRHARLGWCWTPDTVWGPSWVSWRVGGNYCGWAPLPPAASFRAETGLTFHGRHVGSSCDFGLRASSFKFVDLHHFGEHHLAAHALPHHEANRIFNRTVVSTRIAGNHRTVINHGIAPEQVAAATGTPVHKVNLREVTSASVRPPRDRLEANGSRLTVFRPNLAVSAQRQPTLTEKPRTVVTGNNGAPLFSTGAVPTSTSRPPPSHGSAPASVAHQTRIGPAAPQENKPLQAPHQITQSISDEPRTGRTPTRHNTGGPWVDTSHRSVLHSAGTAAQPSRVATQSRALPPQNSGRVQPPFEAAQNSPAERQPIVAPMQRQRVTAPPHEASAPFNNHPALSPQIPQAVGPTVPQTQSAPVPQARPAPAVPAPTPVAPPQHSAPAKSSRPTR